MTRGGCEVGYLRFFGSLVSSSNALTSWLAAASAAARTNRDARPWPAAAWIASRSAALRRNANTTSGSFGAFSFFGFTTFSSVLFLLTLTSCAGPHTQRDAMTAWNLMQVKEILDAAR